MISRTGDCKFRLQPQLRLQPHQRIVKFAAYFTVFCSVALSPSFAVFALSPSFAVVALSPFYVVIALSPSLQCSPCHRLLQCSPCHRLLQCSPCHRLLQCSPRYDVRGGLGVKRHLLTLLQCELTV